MPTVKTKRKLKADAVIIPREKILDFFRQNPFPSLAPRKNKKADRGRMGQVCQRLVLHR